MANFLDWVTNTLSVLVAAKDYRGEGGEGRDGLVMGHLDSADEAMDTCHLTFNASSAMIGGEGCIEAHEARHKEQLIRGNAWYVHHLLSYASCVTNINIQMLFVNRRHSWTGRESYRNKRNYLSLRLRATKPGDAVSDALVNRLGHLLQRQLVLDSLYHPCNGRLKLLDALLHGRDKVADVSLPSRCPLGGLAGKSLLSTGHHHV